MMSIFTNAQKLFLANILLAIFVAVAVMCRHPGAGGLFAGVILGELAFAILQAVYAVITLAAAMDGTIDEVGIGMT